jgi:transposase
MLSFSGSLKVLVAVEACDMRKGFNGLHALVTERLGEDPQGALFVFSNRRHTRIKILCWDGTGLWVLTKRLEQGNFFVAQESGTANDQVEVDAAGAGDADRWSGFARAKLRPWYEREGLKKPLKKVSKSLKPGLGGCASELQR